MSTHFKIKMLRTVIGANYDPRHTFHKDYIYRAEVASNQPEYIELKKVFAFKLKPYAEILLEKGEYEIINGTADYHFGNPKIYFVVIDENKFGYVWPGQNPPLIQAGILNWSNARGANRSIGDGPVHLWENYRKATLADFQIYNICPDIYRKDSVMRYEVPVA